MNILNENRTLGEKARHKDWCQCGQSLVHTAGRQMSACFVVMLPSTAQPGPHTTFLATDY